MQTLVTLLLMLFVSGAFAQTNPPTYGEYGYGTAPLSSANTCISDICGPPAQSKLYMTKYLDRLDEYVRLAVVPKQIDFPHSTSKLFTDLLAENDKQIETALSLFKKSIHMGSAQPEGISKAIYNVMYASPFLKKIKYKTSMVNGKMTATVDEAASIAELKDLEPENRNWILQAAKYFAAKSSDSLLSDSAVQSQPAELLLKILHPGKPVAEAMNAELSQAQTSIATLKIFLLLKRRSFLPRLPQKESLSSQLALQKGLSTRTRPEKLSNGIEPIKALTIFLEIQTVHL